jgi:hypothetical protein
VLGFRSLGCQYMDGLQQKEAQSEENKEKPGYFHSNTPQGRYYTRVV